MAEKNDMHLLRATIEKYLPKQSKPVAGPFTLAASGVLEKLVESAGLEVISGEIVPITFYFENSENLMRKQLSSGVGQNALATFGANRPHCLEFFDNVVARQEFFDFFRNVYTEKSGQANEFFMSQKE